MNDVIQRGQRAFRRELARDERETARRLLAAYKSFYQDIDSYIQALEQDAENASSTRDLRDTDSFKALRDELDFALSDLAKLIERESRKMEDSGIKVSRDYVASTFRLVGITGSFNQPTVQSIKALVGYVDSDAFQGKLAKYGEYHTKQIGNIVLSEASRGKNPIHTARQIRRHIQTMPAVDAFRMTRTVQVMSTRKGTQIIYQQNREVILGWWWSSALDERTCMSCVSQHGRKFSVDDMLSDHHQGRCAMVPITALSVNDNIQTGEDWFRSLPESQQQMMMGRGMWEAWKDGEFKFDALTTSYQDSVYGTMYQAASLKSIRESAFDRAVRPEAYAPRSIEINAPPPLPIERARLITPDKLESENFDDPVVQELWGMAEYDDRANVLYNKLAIDNRYSDMLYELYKIGRNEPTKQDIEFARLVSGTVLAAYEHTGVKLTAKQKRLLEGLAFGDTVSAIDQVKDNRMKTRIRTGGYKGGEKFVSASDADAAARLRENRAGNRSF